MNILFITPSYKPATIYGGTTVAVSQLAESLAYSNIIDVYTTTANGKDDFEVNNFGENMDGVNVYYFKRITGDHTNLSFSLWLNLFQNVKKYDIVHIHSWWSPLILIATFICWLRGIQPVLSPHGMLSPYIFKANHSLSKKIIHQSIGKFLLSKTILHVSTDLELAECREVIPSWKGTVIYNQIQLSEKVFERTNNDIFTIGFISRIDPKKGLDRLIIALSQVEFDFKLKVAGEGNPEYMNQLKKIVVDYNLENKVEWCGWKNNDEKYIFLSSLDLFALTSHSENFAIVVVEALSVGTPALISRYVGLSSFIDDNSLGWSTDNSIKDIANKLHIAYDNKVERKRIEQEGPVLIKDIFNQKKIALEYLNWYNTLMKKA